LLKTVVFDDNARAPRAVFWLPLMLAANADRPIAVLPEPVLKFSVPPPIAVLSVPLARCTWSDREAASVSPSPENRTLSSTAPVGLLANRPDVGPSVIELTPIPAPLTGSHTTVPFSLTVRTACPVGHVPVTRRWIFVASMAATPIAPVRARCGPGT